MYISRCAEISLLMMRLLMQLSKARSVSVGMVRFMALVHDVHVLGCDRREVHRVVVLLRDWEEDI